MTLEFHAESLWLIPVGLALWFMLWVLWNWWREERRSRSFEEPVRLKRSLRASPPEERSDVNAVSGHVPFPKLM